MIKRFKLGGVDWRVVQDSKRMDDLNLLGLCEHWKALITINEDANIDIVNETIYHEVIHAILRTMNRLELNEDEEFVQSFAALLYQFEKTKK